MAVIGRRTPGIVGDLSRAWRLRPPAANHRHRQTLRRSSPKWSADPSLGGVAPRARREKAGPSRRTRRGGGPSVEGCLAAASPPPHKRIAARFGGVDEATSQTEKKTAAT